MDLQVIRKVVKDKGISIKILSSKIGMSETNLHKCIRDNKITANDLEKIAEVLNLPVNMFFSNKNIETTLESNKNLFSDTKFSIINDIDLCRSKLFQYYLALKYIKNNTIELKTSNVLRKIELNFKNDLYFEILCIFQESNNKEIIESKIFRTLEFYQNITNILLKRAYNELNQKIEGVYENETVYSKILYNEIPDIKYQFLIQILGEDAFFDYFESGGSGSGSGA